jgi:hypothetical protein
VVLRLQNAPLSSYGKSALVNLTTLDVRFNAIRAAGAASLATLVNLTTLDVRRNEIGVAGEATLAALTHCRVFM